ncbi:MAG: double-strand break repair protein AddB, partial [Pseudomonadota bacterium]
MTLCDPAQRRRMQLDRITRQYLEYGSKGPVIAAGSTGSVPATARLITAISKLENGAVVLPGVDKSAISNLLVEMNRSTSSVTERNLEATLSTHPQYGLNQLINEIGIAPEMIQPLGQAEDSNQARSRLISLAMLPAASTGVWAQSDPEDSAVDNLAMIEAQDQREEALAIAIALRKALETEGKTAALTTPDRNLARRVAAELRRFNVMVDDSGGMPLSSSEAFRFALLLLKAAFGQGDAVALTALFKHPFLCGDANSEASRVARLFEIAILRDAMSIPKPGEFEATIEKRRQALESNPHAPRQIRTLTDEAWQEMVLMARAIERAIEPLSTLMHEGKVALAIALKALRESLERILVLNVENQLDPISDSFDLVLEFLDDFSGAGGTDLTVRPAEIGGVLSAFAENVTYQQAGQTHPRLSIWGPLEARLQSVDLMVLGGLNEGIWPAPGKNDPFLNRSMKASLGMALPERRIGLSAHDFQQLSGHGEVIYSRAVRSANAPTIASRWLQRLATVAGAEAAAKIRKRGQYYLDLARMLDASADETGEWGQVTGRPCPKPAVQLRPMRLSITEIETWIRDPYAIFARHVLGLAPLPPLVRQADALLKGLIFHKILERFIEEEHVGDPLKRILEISAQTFRETGVPREVAGIWQARFDEIADNFVNWEVERTEAVQNSFCELSGKINYGYTGFELRGRADRVDIMQDGSLTILDYKTGLNPSIKQARTFSPQLALEAKMAQLGAFIIPGGSSPGALGYVRLRPDDVQKVDWVSASKDGVSAQELADDAWARLGELVHAYTNPDQGYQSRRAPFLEADITGDYDHLARTREWMVLSDADGEGDG